MLKDSILVTGRVRRGTGFVWAMRGDSVADEQYPPRRVCCDQSGGAVERQMIVLLRLDRAHEAGNADVLIISEKIVPVIYAARGLAFQFVRLNSIPHHMYISGRQPKQTLGELLARKGVGDHTARDPARQPVHQALMPR